MPAKKKKKQPEKLIRRILRKLRRIGLIAAGCLIAWMLIDGSIVRLRTAELPLDCLPASFSGTTILYLSDLHINSLNSVGKVSALMDELMSLKPDLLLLGGDYTSFDPIMRITAPLSGASDSFAVETDMRDLFFRNLSKYNPPLGKYGVAGEADNLLERNGGTSLADAMRLGGVTLLRDQAVTITKNGESIVLVGVDDWSTGLQDTRTPASQVRASDCVILLCHNPEAIPSLNNQPAQGGIWIDAALSGHTHDGGVRLFGYGLFSSLSNEERFQTGWHLENSAKVLISGGVGNALLPLRLNAEPQAHFITLTGP